MEEIIKLQIKALEVKLTVAKNERIDDLKAKIKKLQEMIKPIEPIQKKQAVPEKPNKRDLPRKRVPKPVVKEEPKEELPVMVQEEIKELMVEEPVEENALKEIVEDPNAPEGVSIFEEPIVMNEELPTVAEIEEELEILDQNEGDLPLPEKESEGVQDETDQGDPEKDPAVKEEVEETPPPAVIIEVPVVEPPVVETNTTTRKKRKYTKRKTTTKKKKQF